MFRNRILLFLLLAGNLGLSTACSVVDHSTRNRHQINITRIYQGSFERELISKAESAPPSDEACATLAKRWHGRRSAEEWKHNWQAGGFDGVPTAVYFCQDALHYYEALIQKFRHGDFSQTQGRVMTESALSYRANVEWKVSTAANLMVFTDVYVVNLTFSWNQYCGPLCAMSFSVDRRVVFDRDGNILAIEGDDEERITLVS